MEKHKDVKEILVSKDAIDEKLKHLGEQISKDYAGKTLVVVGILKGSFMFMADLVRHIHGVEVLLEFMAVSSYGNETQSSGAVRMIMDLRLNIMDKDVLIVEDVIDSGLTIQYLLDLLRGRKPRSLEVCVLLQKKNPNLKTDVKYIGFQIPLDAFVVGYGLDFAEKLRHLPYVGILKPECYKKS
eukprot:TRINITY_DN8727_c0_g1_i1.p1 TRINITY_DN8727_c0_g1~~TRINITY_DN8727_c0_g1_i1.p1  ORF type:complete len:184 (-),score=30.05 TRINITY_DN8727_c0_g1_i1:70-621(-)